MNFIAFINFNGSFLVKDSTDLFKFSKFCYNINYVVLKITNSILNKSLFYLLVR